MGRHECKVIAAEMEWRGCGQGTDLYNFGNECHLYGSRQQALLSLLEELFAHTHTEVWAHGAETTMHAGGEG